MKDKNILIANFLGWENNKDGSYETPFYWEDKEVFISFLSSRYDFKPEDMDFDTDWNWLMAVVDKIESLGNYGFTVYRKSVNINGLPFELANTRGITKIEAVYNACVEFIEWYNNN